MHSKIYCCAARVLASKQGLQARKHGVTYGFSVLTRDVSVLTGSICKFVAMLQYVAVVASISQ